jgi:hypothetical protein
MVEERRTLVELPSGKVELVWNGLWVLLQFNAKCVDCLPYCHAMCCRTFSIGAEEDEAHKFRTKPHPITKLPMILRNDQNVCTHLQKDCKCEVHADKPKMCRRFACSPGTEIDDETITRRDAGWLINLVRKEEAEMVQLQLAEVL